MKIKSCQFRGTWRAYLVAFGFSTSAALLNLLLSDYLHRTFFILPLATIIYLSFIVGYAPAFFALSISAFFMTLLFVKSVANRSLTEGQYSFKVFIFMIMGASLAWLGARLKKSLLETEAALKQAKVAEDLREHFVVCLSHDLRNPLSAAKARIALLLRTDLSKPELVKNLNRVDSTLNRLNNMIENLLDVSALQRGKIVGLELKRIDVCGLLKTLVEDAQFLYGNRVTLLCPPESIYLECDSQAITRVLENLIANAAKYGDSEKSINLSCQVTDGIFRISVQNFGRTIPSDLRVKLFEPFYRDLTEKRQKPGWGIGLAVVKALVEAHRGRVLVESTERNGTIFSVEVPIGSTPTRIKADGTDIMLCSQRIVQTT